MVGVEERARFATVTAAAFYSHASAEEDDGSDVSAVQEGRAIGAYVDGELVGTARELPLEVTLPGFALSAMCGVAAVGVLPTYRRQGLLWRMMRYQLEQAHERGDALSGLNASEGGIYGRYGYGIATFIVSWVLERRSLQSLCEGTGDGRLQLVGREEARRLLPLVQDRVRRSRVGDVSPTEWWWEGVLGATTGHAEGPGGKFFAVHSGLDGAVDGGLVFRVPGKGAGERAVEVDYLEAESPGGYRALFALMRDLDLAESIMAHHRPGDEALAFMLGNPRDLRITAVRDWLWLRLIDVPRALSDRTYAVPGSVVLEVEDPACPWNEGRWELSGGPDGASCVRARIGVPAEVTLAVGTLASIYLGGVSVKSLVLSGRVGELVPGAATRLAKMVTSDQLPYCSTSF